MVARSRTYLPTDWQLWVYTPVAGVWRWDFSKWDGGDKWGSDSQTGAMTVLDTRIASIELIDGAAPTQGFLGNIGGASLTVSGAVDSWNAAFVQELYNGKKIALTLKNEANYDTPEYGPNTVYFVGRITNCVTTLNPATQEVFYTITAEDYFSQSLSQLITYNRSVIDPKSYSLQTAVDEAQTQGLLPSWLNINLWSASLNTNETAQTKVDTFGVFLQDYVASEVALVFPKYLHTVVGTDIVWLRDVDVRPLFTVSPFKTLTDDDISFIQMANDGSDRPTSFKLSNETATLDVGGGQQGYLASQNTYTNTIDTTTAGLQHVITTLQSTSSKLSPVTVDIEAATTFQPIVYTYTGSDSYIFPDTNFSPGDEIMIDSATLGETYNVVVVAVRHLITTDNWVTTLELSKGL